MSESLPPTSFIGCLRHGWDLTPWDCIEMQLHPARIWIGWPCNGCERPVIIETAPEPAITMKQLSPAQIEQGRAAVKRLAQKMGFCPDSPPPPVSASQKRRTWPKGMSKSVARRLGLVKENR